jgi:hypothetical protein
MDITHGRRPTITQLGDDAIGAAAIDVQVESESADDRQMAQEVASWVTVREAADEVGTTEARIRAAYRAGKLAAQDVRIAGRVRKMVSLSDVRAWADGTLPVPTPVAVAEAAVAPPVEAPVPPVPAPAPAPAPVVVEDTSRFDDLLELAEQAMARATRAENQVAFLRNELAQLRESHVRVQTDFDRRNAEEFRATARLAAATAAKGPKRAGIRRILGRASA